ncbi:hypothetical protein BC826DRAFT_973823 [Russula brevipes]|nr:hypothetical protein BC826DRAFT_973823 [Russula brevipes]
MNDNLTTRWDNFRGIYRTAVKDEVKEAVSALLEDLRNHVNKTIDDRLGARLGAIQGSAAKGLDGSQKEEMSRSLRLELTNNNAELVRQLGDHIIKEDSGVQKVRRVISSQVNRVTSMLDKQKASTSSLLTKLEDISKAHLTVCNVIEQILRPLRETLNNLHVEIPRLNETLINTQDILCRMEGSGPALPLEGDAQVEHAASDQHENPVASGGAVDLTESADPTIIAEGWVDKGKGRAMENEEDIEMQIEDESEPGGAKGLEDESEYLGALRARLQQTTLIGWVAGRECRPSPLSDQPDDNDSVPHSPATPIASRPSDKQEDETAPVIPEKDKDKAPNESRSKVTELGRKQGTFQYNRGQPPEGRVIETSRV